MFKLKRAAKTTHGILEFAKLRLIIQASQSWMTSLRVWLGSVVMWCLFSLQPFCSLIQIHGHNRARQRDKLGHILEEFATLQDEVKLPVLHFLSAAPLSCILQYRKQIWTVFQTHCIEPNLSNVLIASSALPRRRRWTQPCTACWWNLSRSGST